MKKLFAFFVALSYSSICMAQEPAAPAEKEEVVIRLNCTAKHPSLPPLLIVQYEGK